MAKAAKPKEIKTKKAVVKVKTEKPVLKKTVTKKAKTTKALTNKRGRPRKVKDELKEGPVIPRPTKPAYPKEDLEYFRKIILEKRQEIIQQLESLRERMLDSSTGQYVNENSPYSLHMAEQGTDAMEKEKNYLWAQRETKFLGYLEDALKRIDDGTYGYCIDCGAVISKGRLEAVPHSQHCIACKTKFSK